METEAVPPVLKDHEEDNVMMRWLFPLKARNIFTHLTFHQANVHVNEKRLLYIYMQKMKSPNDLVLCAQNNTHNVLKEAP